ncbi:NADPH:quinone reductase-like Zn-dependent oxidoreductase [Amycolatopsis echigonensis]|uniref:NADPH:quinone reductase-like Zn-dependent oxidoreductase n=1 Tax=Amycolatopsis echigonensis TaxID=2576905 RepID=A0A2N3WP24_9PSEU|nr:NADP-dependent oxidoreductase [Amycolatopsis niigatensis]PKV95626.1 NADPH:quinone reductase-like Zn-dependent oxidoreductase [Amycolatopsis niigatensis]
MRTLRFSEHGPAAQVLRVEDAAVPEPGPGRIRVAVQACGLNPADWALCEGLFAGDLPRGIGLEVSGTVDALGGGATGVDVGDPVFGIAPFTGPTAGASEQALLDTWFPRPDGVDAVHAAALPMAVGTAYAALDALGSGTLLVHGAGTTTGFAAAQIALLRGARVIVTAGETHAAALRSAGAEVTGYQDGIAERVTALAGGPVDRVLDAAPFSGKVSELVRTVKEPGHVLKLDLSSDQPGVQTIVSSGAQPRYDVLGEFASLAAEGRFSIPVSRIFPLDDWRAALELSQSRRARGKLVLAL